MRTWEMEPEELAELPIDELALAVLRDIHENGEWNFYNWLNSARHGGASPQSLRVLAEAIDWLRMHGLLTRDPTQSSSEAVFVSRLGMSALANGLEDVRATARIQVDLHPILEQRVRRQFLLGEYDLAAFEGMKQGEIRVRELANATDSDIGVPLMRQAFGNTGPLRDEHMDGGEKVARMELFAGAIGLFKNPTSHR
jgi:uncharacterized protein (TIGR02391 family)